MLGAELSYDLGDAKDELVLDIVHVHSVMVGKDKAGQVDQALALSALIDHRILKGVGDTLNTPVVDLSLLEVY